MIIIVENGEVLTPIEDLEEVYRDWPESQVSTSLKTVLLRCGYAWPKGLVDKVIGLLSDEDRERLETIGRRMAYCDIAMTAPHLCPRCGGVLPDDRMTISDPLVGHMGVRAWVTCPECGESYPRKEQATGRAE